MNNEKSSSMVFSYESIPEAVLSMISISLSYDETSCSPKVDTYSRQELQILLTNK